MVKSIIFGDLSRKQQSSYILDSAEEMNCVKINMLTYQFKQISVQKKQWHQAVTLRTS